MRNKQKSSAKIIVILSCLALLSAFCICLLLIYTITTKRSGNISVAKEVYPASEEVLPFEGQEKDSKMAPSLSEEPVFPDVFVPNAEPDMDYVLSSSPSESKTVFDSPADIVDAVKDGVVGILNYHYDRNKGTFYSYGSSSGFIVSPEGYILTNAHAVSDAKKIDVSFSDGSNVEALMVGYDLNTDIAVIKIPTKKVPCYLCLGDSETLRVGEYVLAIGNPLTSDNLYGSVSMGIISGLDRNVNIDGFTNTFIQTDAALNPGNSGGPLLDMKGRVIGMNTAKSITAGYDSYGRSISSEGIGFSLPIDDVLTIANTLIQHGCIPRPGIGITVYTLSEEDAESAALIPGVLVDSVNVGSPAESAGLRSGDVIVSCNGEALTDKDRLVEMVQAVPIGDPLTFSVYRNGEYLDITVSIGNMNDFNRYAK